MSTRRIREITEQLCGHEFSTSRTGRRKARLDEELEKFARRLEEDPYRVPDARYERVREDGVVSTQAVRVARGITWEGRRCGLAVEVAHRESQSSGKELLQSLRERGPHGVELVVSDDKAG